MVTGINVYEICKCCNGSGVQTNKEGITLDCPCCGGQGQRWRNTAGGPVVTCKTVH